MHSRLSNSSIKTAFVNQFSDRDGPVFNCGIPINLYIFSKCM